MIKIYVITPDPADGNSFWRCMGPLTYLAKQSQGEIEITLCSSKYSWVDFSQYDIIFLHRPCTRDSQIAMQIAYNLGKPVWVDYDDMLFQIPGWNPHAELYHSKEFQLNMAHSLACADVVTVTTAELYNQYSKINDNVVIVPNAYRSDIFTYRSETPPPRQDLAIWRGSNTHDGDLMSVKDGFKKIQHKTMFMGNPSWMLLSGMDKTRIDLRRAADVILYFNFIYEQKPKVFVFPLYDCLFNRCKSNIAYIEAMHAGAICVAPDLPEWKREGIFNYTPHNSDSFAEVVEQAFQISEQDHQNLIQSAFHAMKESYDIKYVNDIRMQIVEHLMNGKRVKKNPFDQVQGLKALAIIQGSINQVNVQEQREVTGGGIPREVLESILR